MHHPTNRRRFLRTGALAMASAQVLFANRAPQSKKNKPPNVVILLADDLGYGDLGCYGHPNIRTPNLDRMAAEGLRFTSFYAASSVCTPSRAGLLTGRYAVRTGLPNVLGPEDSSGLPASEITLAKALKGMGYRTMAIGKWHLGYAKPEYMPTAHGFDSYFGLLYSNDMIKPWVQTDRPLELYHGTEPVERMVDQGTLTVRYTDEALRFIKASKTRPFFLYLAYAMPHLPISTTAEFLGKSRAGLYGDVIETIDWSVGRIVSEIKRLGVDKNTLVVFTSDNGPWLGLPDRMLQQGNEQWHAGTPGLFRGWKGSTYEGGFRVPGIFRWPALIRAGQVSSEIASALDLFPTVIHAAGGQMPSDRPMDGQDILPLLSGGKPLSAREMFFIRGTALEGVRQGKWKYRLSSHLRDDVGQGKPFIPELYDLDVDPSEQYNVAGRYPDVAAALERRMREFAGETQTTCEFTGADVFNR